MKSSRLDLLRFNRTFFFIFAFHLITLIREKKTTCTRKKSGNKQQLTLMNQWPFNHTKHTRNREILGANENGQIKKNRKTEEIPIGHSSARKQRAQNFSARKKNQKSETEKFYIIILLPDECAVELCELYNTTKYASAVIALWLELYIRGIL